MFGKVSEVWLFCDGALGLADPQRRGGEVVMAGAGAVLREGDGRIVAWGWRRLPPLTNNEAEYAGLLLGLELARKHGRQVVHCRMDSANVVGQMEGRFLVHSARLRPWHQQAVAAVRQFRQVTFTAIPREGNQLADALANEALVGWAVRRGGDAETQRRRDGETSRQVDR